MKILLVFLGVSLVCAFLACSQRQESPSGDATIVVGGFYAEKNPNGTFSVSKVLAVDDVAVHVCIYRNTFPSLPKNLDTSTLSLGKLDDPEGFGISHAPIAKEGWLKSHMFLKQETVKEEELEGYRQYLQEMQQGTKS